MRISDWSSDVCSSDLIASGLTQRALADKLGVKEQQIQRYEQEGYRAANLVRLAEILEAIAVSVEIKITVGSEFEDGHSRPLSFREGLKLQTKEMRKQGWYERFERRMNKQSRRSEQNTTEYHHYFEHRMQYSPLKLQTTN